MTPITRRFYLAAGLAGIASTLGRATGLAQTTSQAVGNGLQITSTGDVRVQQNAAGSQEVGIIVNGRLETEDGIYRTSTGQVVYNDGQITATGDVDVVQNASATQTVYVEQQSSGGGGGACTPGDYRQLDACTVEFCSLDCEWLTFACPGCGCRKGRC